MSALGIAYVILLLGLAGFFACRSRARAFEKAGQKMHSRPPYYGWWAFFMIIVPPLVFFALWTSAGDIYLQRRAYTAMDAAVITQTKNDMGSASMVSAQDLELNHIIFHDLARNLPVLGSDLDSYSHASYASVQQKLLTSKGILLAQRGSDVMLPPAVAWVKARQNLQKIGGIVAILLVLGSGICVFCRVRPQIRARNKVEQIIIGALFLASLIAIATTISIALSMLFQTIRFFDVIPLKNFFFGTVWDPRFSAVGNDVGQFGLLPLLAGTLYIAFVAMCFAVPIGLLAAIYMAEYAPPRLRNIVKPLLEILAGIPTIVYGFFALMTVGPFLRDLSAALSGGQGFIQAQSVLTAGFVMGIMLIPFVSSLSDDIITAVPRALRDGSYGLGATQSETIKKVVLPAALPGVVAALLLAASRAIGETMIVVLAAGVAANITLNPFEPMTTITVKIVNQLTGDMEFNSPQTLVAFALGMTLFVLTLLMNIFALYIVRKYREQYE